MFKKLTFFQNIVAGLMIGVTQKSVLTLPKIVSMMANMDLTALAIHFYYMLSFQKSEKFWQIVLFNFFCQGLFGRAKWHRMTKTSKTISQIKNKMDNLNFLISILKNPKSPSPRFVIA